MLLNVDDFRTAARARLAGEIFDLIDGGAGDEVTLRRNRAAFERIALRPRLLVDASDRDLGTTVLGQPVSMPILLDPTANANLAHPDGELGVARAAARAGIVYAVSTLTSVTLEQIAAATDGPKWFQLYPPPDAADVDALVDRAAVAGYGALCVTVDVPVGGLRERWRRSAARTAPPDPAFPPQSRFVTEHDIESIRDRWPGPLLIKGVQRGDEVERLIELGVDGLVVSNHGGRQLDGVLASIEILPEVIEASAGRLETFVDGGVRRGTDVVKALALGARAVLIGRPYLYGLAVAGEQGVSDVIEILRAELDNAFALMGVRSVSELGAADVRVGSAGAGGERLLA